MNIFKDAKPGDKFRMIDGTILTYIRKSDIPNNPFPHQLDIEPDDIVAGRDCFTDEGICAYAIVDNWEDKTYRSIVEKVQ